MKKWTCHCFRAHKPRQWAEATWRNRRRWIPPSPPTSEESTAPSIHEVVAPSSLPIPPSISLSLSVHNTLYLFIYIFTCAWLKHERTNEGAICREWVSLHRSRPWSVRRFAEAEETEWGDIGGIYLYCRKREVVRMGGKILSLQPEYLSVSCNIIITWHKERKILIMYANYFRH